MAVLDHAVLVLARLVRARRGVVMLLAAGREALADRTLDGEVAAGLRLQVSVVHFHLHNSHEFNLSR